MFTWGWALPKLRLFLKCDKHKLNIAGDYIITEESSLNLIFKEK